MYCIIALPGPLQVLAHSTLTDRVQQRGVHSIVIKYIGSPHCFKENCTICTKKDWYFRIKRNQLTWKYFGISYSNCWKPKTKRKSRKKQEGKRMKEDTPYLQKKKYKLEPTSCQKPSKQDEWSKTWKKKL